MDRKWYRRTNFNTILIDLSEHVSNFSRFNATTRKEVRRAERTGSGIRTPRLAKVCPVLQRICEVEKTRDHFTL